MNEAFEDGTSAGQHAVGKRTRGHLDLDILGRDLASCGIGNMKGDVVVAVFRSNP